jgi:ATP-binding cassette subfamily F protein 3
MQADSPVGMVPMIRNILGGFLFSGDDIYKRAGVLSGGERTRLAVARMLLRPANTLLLDEPTNHLDLDSKDVLLEALEDFGGTLVFVSHDRYFVDKLATKIIEVGHQAIEVYPGTYEEFLWSREKRQETDAARLRGGPTVKEPARQAPAAVQPPTRERKETHGRGDGKLRTQPARQPVAYEEKKKADAETRRKKRARDDRARRIADLEARIAAKEAEIRDLEARMAEPGFYDQRTEAETAVSRHQSLMWEVGDLMNQWESLESQEVSD